MSEDKTPTEPEEDHDGDPKKGLMGKVNEKLGWLTADRTKEAQGRLQQADAAGGNRHDGGEDEDSSAADAVDKAERQVRAEYGDLAPGVADDE